MTAESFDPEQKERGQALTNMLLVQCESYDPEAKVSVTALTIALAGVISMVAKDEAAVTAVIERSAALLRSSALDMFRMQR